MEESPWVFLTMEVNRCFSSVTWKLIKYALNLLSLDEILNMSKWSPLNVSSLTIFDKNFFGVMMMMTPPAQCPAAACCSESSAPPHQPSASPSLLSPKIGFLSTNLAPWTSNKKQIDFEIVYLSEAKGDLIIPLSQLFIALLKKTHALSQQLGVRKWNIYFDPEVELGQKIIARGKGLSLVFIERKKGTKVEEEGWN